MWLRRKLQRLIALCRSLSRATSGGPVATLQSVAQGHDYRILPGFLSAVRPAAPLLCWIASNLNTLAVAAATVHPDRYASSPDVRKRMALMQATARQRSLPDA
jgi:hypothetical protein